MTQELFLWIIPESNRKEENQRANELLQKLPNTTVRIVVCPPSVEEMYDLPFTRDEQGGGIFGVEEIESFVHTKLDQRR